MTSSNASAGRREWFALAALTLSPLLVAMDITVLYFAVPSIAGALQPTGVEQLWMIDIYGFVLAGMLITMGNIGDIIGRRRLIMIGSALFGLASALAAFSTSPEMLIVARALQGLAGSTLMPSALGLVRNTFHDEKQRRSAIAVFSIGSAMGVSLGPVVGGVLLSNFWWGSVFLINVPVIAVLLVAIPLLVSEVRTPKAKIGSFDVLSSLLSLVAALALVWGLKEAATSGIGTFSAGSIVIGLVVAAVFVLRQTHLSHPMIDPGLFRSRGFGPTLFLTLASFFCVVGFGMFTTQYLLEVLGMSPMEAGLWLLITPVLAGVFAPIATNLVNTVRPAYVIAVMFLIGVGGFAAMTQLTVDRNLLLVLGGAAAIGVSSSVVLPLLTDMVVSVAPAERAGSVAALQRTAQELGGAFGIAVFGSIGAAVYGSALITDLPKGVAAVVPEAARETIGAATAAAGRLGGEQGAALLTAARAAFTASLTTAALVGVGVALVAAVVTVVRLRHISYAENGSADGSEDGPAAGSEKGEQEAEQEQEPVPVADAESRGNGVTR
ncbi:MFS transporter [Streptosporangium sp. NBC_01756]|uniref:MFS transporter n=1 Tax=Streptosporangium sp. NBC_01756 TaxID=2975950 RepID=UPI002DDA69BB|nr:MFS transporter [Streptosporangium sp. NBC_01756]WSC88649.1 MFS transporter [Streptosporangium sp. NBC_01756]